MLDLLGFCKNYSFELHTCVNEVKKMLDDQGPSRTGQVSSLLPEELPSTSSSTSSRTAAPNRKESKSSTSRSPKARSTAAKRYLKKNYVSIVASLKDLFRCQSHISYDSSFKPSSVNDALKNLASFAC